MLKKFYFAQKAFILKDGKLLLIKKLAKDPIQPNKWEVPGGRMKFGEDIDESIKREVYEEVGLLIEPGEPFFIWQWQFNHKTKDGVDERIQIVAVARLCQYKAGSISIEGQEEEDYISDCTWVKLGDIKKHDIIANMYPVIDKLLKMYPQ